MRRNALTLAILTALSAAAAGCGVADQGRAPATMRIDLLEAKTGGNQTATFGGYLDSDVLSAGGVFADAGQVTVALVLRDPGTAGLTTSASELNTIQITHYRVTYRRTDGRNVQGVDVPYTFDSGMTFSIGATGASKQTFEIVRVTAKRDPPLLPLATNGQALDMIADVTLYGKDMHNNDVSATGSIGITFANFAG